MIINASSNQIPLADGSVHAVVTSPPYFGLRKYEGAQDVSWPAGSYAPMTGCPPCVDVPAMACPFGNEPTIEAYVFHSLLILRECRRVLRDDGVLWWNIGDSYAADRSGTAMPAQTVAGGVSGKGNAPAFRGMPEQGGAHRNARGIGVKHGDLMGIPHRVMLAAQADGWTVRNDCVWAKVAPMPESVKGWRFDADGNLTRGSWRHTRAHEFVFQMTKGMGYYSDGESVKERANRGAAGSTFTNGKTGVNGAGRVGQGDRIEDGARNPRSVLTPPPSAYNGAHFAVFPPELIRPLILSSVPRRCCSKCGAGWAAVIKTPDFSEQPKRSDARKMDRSDRTSAGQKWQEWRDANPDKIQGSRPTCDCNEPSHVPGIVLDPFCGSGTTGEVARESLVRFIGLDISLPYLRDQASWRAERKVSAAKVEEMPLFAMTETAPAMNW